MAINFAGTNVYYVPQTKCACTTLRSVVYLHKTGKLPIDENKVHEEIDAIGVNVDNKNITKDDLVFGIVRDPIDRFLSFYNDKVAGQHKQQWLLDVLDRDFGLTGNHTIDCGKALDHAIDTFVGRSREKVDPHWAFQISKAHIYRNLRAILIPIEKMSIVLPDLLEQPVPNFTNLLKAVGQANKSSKALTRKEISGTELESRIAETYRLDHELYSAVCRHMNIHDKPTPFTKA
ncbi:sulfotransferase family 2 domain-containing protein [Labrenzia sp. CE80]|uniref:sulfotransferase family 2 domain-containing protein n=1 Tax=Labrenzia sp. CE80 TaxID=1788986 RepID=UPI00129AF997|nr:sulfotransferase family 2 domain-containing protein [Labrenzia sp. CE80]